MAENKDFDRQEIATYEEVTRKPLGRPTPVPLSTAFEQILAVARKLDTQSSDHSSPNKQKSPILDYSI